MPLRPAVTLSHPRGIQRLDAFLLLGRQFLDEVFQEQGHIAADIKNRSAPSGRVMVPLLSKAAFKYFPAIRIDGDEIVVFDNIRFKLTGPARPRL